MSDPGDKPRRRRRWVWVVIAAAAIILLLVLLAPTLLSTGPGNRVLVNIVNGRIAGSIKADSIKLAWFGGQSASGVSVFEPDGDEITRGVNLDVPDYTLVRAVFGSTNYGNVNVATRDTINITQRPGEPTNLQRAFSDPNKPSGDKRSRSASKQKPSDKSTGLKVNLNFTAKAVDFEGPGLEPVEFSDVSAMVNLSGSRHVNVKLTSGVRQGGGVGAIDADVKLDTSAADAAVDANIKLTNLPLDAIDRMAGQDGRLVALAGPILSATVTARGKLDSLQADVSAAAEHLTINGKLQTVDGRLTTGAGSAITLDVTPESYAALTGGTGEDAVTLLKPFRVEFKLTGLDLPQTNGEVALADASLAMDATVTDIELNVPDRGPVALRGAKLNVVSQKLGEALSAKLDATAQLGGVSEPVSAGLVVRNPLGGEAGLDANLTVNALPVALVEALAQQDGRLAAVIGDTLDLNVNLKRDGAEALVFDGKATSPHLQGPFAGSYHPDGGGVILNTPQPMRMTLTPQALGALQQTDDGAPPPLALEQPIDLSLDLQRFDSKDLSVVGKLSMPLAVFIDNRTQQRIRMTDAAVDIDGQNLRELVNLNVKALVDTQSQHETTPGKLESVTQVRGLADDAGKLSIEHARITNTTTLTDVPSVFLGDKAAAVLGPMTSAKVDFTYEPGIETPADIAIDSANVTGNVAANITQDRHVTLREDINVKAVLTEQSAKALYGDLHPALDDAVGSEEPARLTISKDGFRVPLEDFDLKEVSMHGTLSPGVVKMRRSGWVNQGVAGLLTDALRVLGVANLGTRGQEPTYLATFSTMRFQLDRGAVQTSELWLTTPSMGVGFQGGFDLNTNAFAGMTFGVLGATLIEANPKVARYIAPGQVASLPITGSLDKPKYQFDKFITDLGLAVAKQKTGSKADPWINLGGAILDGLKKDKDKTRRAHTSWKLPENAQAFVQQVEEKLAAERQPDPAETTEPQGETQDTQPQEQGQQQDRPRRRFRDRLENR